jgi:hypothetical protein
MHDHSFIHRAILLGTFLIVAGFGASAAIAADKASTAPDVAVAAASNAMAAGATEDSLQACMARIPKDATVGQRMIAEQSCRRDEGDRKPFQATGGR